MNLDDYLKRLGDTDDLKRKRERVEGQMISLRKQFAELGVTDNNVNAKLEELDDEIERLETELATLVGELTGESEGSDAAYRVGATQKGTTRVAVEKRTVKKRRGRPAT